MIMRTLGLIVLVAALVAGGMGAVRAQGGGEFGEIADWRLVDVQKVDEVVGEVGPHTMTLSPDGSMIAWWERGEKAFCVAVLDSGDRRCTPAPENLAGIALLAWSPDSRFVVGHEDVLRHFVDSDLWLFDVTSGQIINRTDDDLVGSFFDAPAALLDFLPVWNPASGDLFFFRVGLLSVDGERVWTTGLYRIAQADLLSDTLPEPVADLTTAFPVEGGERSPIPIFYYQQHSLNGMAAISPDGTRLAVIAETVANRITSHGVWLIDLTTGSTQRLASYESLLTAGFPEWTIARAGIALEGLSWTADGTGVVVALVNIVSTAMAGTNVLYVDAASGVITPLVDFRDVENERDFFTALGPDGHAPGYDQPNFSVMLPDGSALIYRNANFEDATGFSALAVPPQPGATPTRLLTVPREEVAIMPMYWPSAGGTDRVARVLVIGSLLTFERVE